MRPKREHDTDIGIGGYKCRCCGPGVGRCKCLQRKKHRRRVRSRRKSTDQQEIDEAMAEVDPEGKCLP